MLLSIVSKFIARRTLLLAPILVLIALSVTPFFAQAQSASLPSTFESGEGTQIKAPNPLTIEMEIPELILEESPQHNETAQMSDAEMIQKISELPGAPDYLGTLTTDEAWDTLTEEQRAEASAFILDAMSGGPGKTANGEDAGNILLENTVSCFDYYTFGSVQAVMQGDAISYEAGSTSDFIVSITNNNTYPIIDGSVYIKLFRINPAASPSQGSDVVDQRFVIEGINIAGNSTTAKSISYTFPDDLPSGEYHLVTYFSSAHRFNLLGLPFTDDVFGNELSYYHNW
jgi:hypothetical protein